MFCRKHDIRKISSAPVLLLGGFLLHPFHVAHAQNMPSPTLSGATGLNTIPTARTQENGRITIGAGTLDPFLHSYIGIQIAAPLEIVLRQTAQISSLRGGAYALDPGLDFKARLLEETAHAPAIAAGIQSALGDTSMRMPYVALSKRYNEFDFTLGKGWGRYDETFGIFAGIEYFLPIKGVSAKLDYAGQSYKDEEKGTGYKSAPPIGLGLNYVHSSGASASLGVQGADKIFARLSYSSSPQQWNLHKKHPPPEDFYTRRPAHSQSQNIPQNAAEQGLYVSEIEFIDSEARGRLALNGGVPTAHQIGRTARIIAKDSQPDIEQITITPEHLGFQGTSITLQRGDLEKSFLAKDSSPEELWHKTSFSDLADSGASAPHLPPSFSIKLEQNLDLSAHHEGIFHKTDLILATQDSLLNNHLLNHIGLRFNLPNNLDATYGNPIKGSVNAIRSDIDLFAQRKISLDTAFISYADSITPDLHFMASAGYLEEQYAGIGAQLLYRPFKSRMAFGGQLWRALKRDPYTFMTMGTRDQAGNVALLEAWYDLPSYDVTLHAQAGHFLGNDNGALLGVEKTFKNGTRLSGSLAISDKKSQAVTGDETRTTQKLNLTIPLGGFRFIPNSSEADFTVGSMGDDLVQNINMPFTLYEATSPLGLKNISENWTTIAE